MNNLYQLDCESATNEQATPACEQRNDMDLWHQRLGHLSEHQLGDIPRKELAAGIRIPKAKQ